MNSRWMFSTAGVVLTGLCVVAAYPIYAQEVASKTEASPAAKPTPNSQPAQFSATAPASSTRKDPTTYFGTYRVRVEDYNWFPASKGNGAYTFVGSQLRFGVSSSTPLSDLLLELEQPTLIGLPTKATGPAPIGNMGQGANYYAANHGQIGSLFIKQAFARFKQVGKNPAASLRAGRFEFADGTETTPADPSLAFLKRYRVAQRLLAPSNFTHVGRSFDGFQFTSDTRMLNVTAMGAMPTRCIYSLDGWDTLDKIKVGYVSVTYPQPGIHAAGEGRLFGIYYEDQRSKPVKVDNRPTAARTADKRGIHICTIGGDYMRVITVGPGKLDGVLWGAGQVGDWGALSQAAYSFDVEGGYQFTKTAWKPWLRAGYNYASGDANLKDSVHGTFVPLLYTSTTFARFPFFNTMNLKDLFGQVILQPNRKLMIRSDIHDLQLAESSDLWYTGSGAYYNLNFGYSSRPSGGHSDLATFVDISINYQESSRLALMLYFGYANGGKVVTASFRGKVADFAYLEALYRF